MAVIECDGKRVEVSDGSSIRDACEELGVPFGCNEGFCGSCLIEVVEGGENLSERTEEEELMGLDDGFRLACQCFIKKGVVKIEF